MSNSTDIPNPRATGFVAKLIAPVAIALLISLAAVLTLIWVAARGQDQVAATSSSELMGAVLHGVERDLGKLVYDYTWWDQAIENLIDRPNLEWASATIGMHAAETFDVAETFVVSQSDKTLFAYRDGVLSRDEAFTNFDSELGVLIEAARASSMLEPTPVTAFLMRGDAVHLVAVSALTPENPTAQQLPHRPRPVLVYTQDMSEARLGALSEQFGFENLRISDAAFGNGVDELSMALRNASGQTVRWLTWRPPHPGSALFADVLPWLAAGVLMLIGLSVVFVRRVLATAQGMAADALSIAEKDRQLAQTSKLAVLGEMAAGVVHELNQPLNIIRMATDTTRESLRGRSDDPAAEKVDAQLSVIGGQTRRMAETIQSMRIFSRDDYGQKIAFDPIRAANHVLSWLRPELAERGIAISLQVPGRCGRVFGEPSRLEQVMVNLVLNARDAVQRRCENGGVENGQISIVISEDIARDTVRIAVRDNGGGIAVDHLERLFEPFFTTKPPGEGTGLGLSISYGIVGSMNGELSVANVDDGALFRIDLPRVASGDNVGSTPASEPAA